MEHQAWRQIINIIFHHLQYLLPENKLKNALDRAFINVINEVVNDEFNEPNKEH